MWNSRSPGVATAVCRVARELGERMQPGRPRRAEQAVPQLGADADHAAQLALGDPKADRSLEAADIREQIADRVLGARIDRQRRGRSPPR